MSQNEIRPPTNRELSEQDLGDLLRTAGPRPEVPEQELRQIRAAAEATWKDLALRQHRKTVRRRLTWAAAASFAIVTLTFWMRSEERVQPTIRTIAVAEVAVLQGTGWAENETTGDRHEIRDGEILSAGTYLETLAETQPSRMAIRFASGSNLRLDVGSRILLESENQVRLLEGAVYLDSDPSLQGSDIVIRTTLGAVYEIGTQFEVRSSRASAADKSVRVRVREGAVRVEHASETLRAAAGDELTVKADGSAEWQKIEPYGPVWSWILETAMPLQEGVSCEQFLHWIGRETGQQIVLSPELRAGSDRNRLGDRLSGVQDLNEQPIEGVLSLAMLSCRLDYTSEEGRLFVSPAP